MYRIILFWVPLLGCIFLAPVAFATALTFTCAGIYNTVTQEFKFSDTIPIVASGVGIAVAKAFCCLYTLLIASYYDSRYQRDPNINPAANWIDRIIPIERRTSAIAWAAFFAFYSVLCVYNHQKVLSSHDDVHAGVFAAALVVVIPTVYSVPFTTDWAILVIRTWVVPIVPAQAEAVVANGAAGVNLNDLRPNLGRDGQLGDAAADGEGGPPPAGDINDAAV